MDDIDREFQRIWLRVNSMRIRDTKTRVNVRRYNGHVQEITPADFINLLQRAWRKCTSKRERGFLVGMTKKYAATAKKWPICHITDAQYDYLKTIAAN